MDHTKLSDFEINKLVSKKLGLPAGESLDLSRCDLGEWLDAPNNIPSPLDYCNSWDHMGPLIVEHHISVFSFITHWRCNSIMSKSTQFYIDDKNPLRAAAIVYLMMDGDLCS